MKFLLSFFVLVGSLHLAYAKEVSTEGFVRHCNAILMSDAGYGNYDDPRFRPINGRAHIARRYMASLSFRQKRRQIQRATQLPLSRNAAQSVAYVAALSGIRPYGNARKMLYYDEPAHAVWTNMGGAAESVFGCIQKIYERFPDRRIALMLLEEHSDGAGGATARAERFYLLKRQPRYVLSLALQSKKAFALLCQDFTADGLATEELPVLRRLCRDRDPILRNGARQIRHRIHAYCSKYHMAYR